MFRSTYLALCIGAATLAGCSLFHPVPKEAPPAAKTLPPPKPVLPAPQATHKFQMDPASDLVGYVQRVVVSKEDTLPDVARRFDVGYEEIHRAIREQEPAADRQQSDVCRPGHALSRSGSPRSSATGRWRRTA